MKKNKLRNGYTTGSCAAAATKAALYILFSKEDCLHVSITTPNQTKLYLEVEEIVKTEQAVSCAIRKDAGDDPDVTHGVLVYAKVTKTSYGIHIDGGEGIGRVTRKGLQQEIGEAAINKVPKQMILNEVERLCKGFNYEEGLEILISIPAGIQLAHKTFNPRLGIIGGISVLGTTGIVEPMSEKALTDTIYVEMKFLKENGHDYCFAVPGNYGSDFLTEQMKFHMDDAVKCSNYIGETIAYAKQLELRGILLVGHIGKFVKLAAGIMNTHSKMADGRMEIIGVHAAVAGAPQRVVEEIMDCVTTAEALNILADHQLLERTMTGIMHKIEEQLGHKSGNELEIGAIVFSEEYGVLGQTTNTSELLEKCQKGRSTK